MASCENKYTTLLDLSRQAKVITGETACFDGKIEAGIPFSGYPTGVDTGTTVSLGVVSSETAVFSGNTGTTVFDVSNTGSTNYNAIFSGYSGTVWTNALFSGNTSGLTLPITTISADTQIVGPIWTLTQTGMTGDYVIGTQYTGYSITYAFSQVEQLSVTAYTAYSGFSSASQENFSAGTLDYKGPLDYISSVEDASIDGRLTTNKLTVTDGASASTIGYVLTQLDETGKAVWAYNSSTASTNTFVTGGTLNSTHLDLTYNTGGSVPSIELSGLTFTGNTSGTCITDLYLTNLYGCSPLHIEPSGSNDVYIVENGGSVGVGTSSPLSNLHIKQELFSEPGLIIEGSGAAGIDNAAAMFIDITARSRWGIGIVNMDTKDFEIKRMDEGFDFGSSGATVVNIDYGTSNVSIGNTEAIIGTKLLIKGDGDSSSTNTLLLQDSGGTTSFVVDDGGNVTMSGFTTMGDSSVGIKMKKLSSTTPSTSSLGVASHGLTQSKIISWDIVVTGTDGKGYKPECTFDFAGSSTSSKYSTYIGSTDVTIAIPAGGTNVDSVPYTVTIWYIE
jgi:hypothetical protein